MNSSEKEAQFSLTALNNLNSLFILILILFVVQSIASFFRIYLFGIVTENSLKDIRENVFKKLIVQNITFYDENKVRELQSRVSSNISLLKETFNTTLAEFIRQILSVLFGIIFITFISRKLSLIMLAIVLLVAISTVFFGKYLRSYPNKLKTRVATQI